MSSLFSSEKFNFQNLTEPKSPRTNTLNCTLLSPMFMMGGDNTTPELREESFIGVMHFWYRALWGHCKAIADIKKGEDLLFGNTAQAGRAWIEISNRPTYRHKDYYSYKPHREENKSLRKAFLSGTFNAELPAEMETLFKLSCLLGGFGGRSRRGFGAVCFEPGGYSTISSVRVRLRVLLAEFSASDTIAFSDNPALSAEKISFTATSDGTSNEFPYVKNIYFGNKEYNTVDDLLKRINAPTSNLKGMYGKKHKNDEDPYGQQMGQAIDGRYASPIIASIVQAGGKYHPIITQLHGTQKTQTNIQEEYIKAVLNS